MAIFTKEFILNEKYVSKYAKYLEDDDDDKNEDIDDEDDEDEEEEDEKSDSHKSKNDKSSDSKKNQSNNSSDEKKTPQHLSKEEIRRIMTIATSTLMDFPKLKKCCDYVDLNDKDHINDDGERESSFGKYYHSSAKAFIELMNGDIYSGYPDFKDKGSEAYEKDAHAFVKAVNEALESRHIQAKFSIGSEKEDDAVSFGVKSTKEK
jgi:hypothetical protein